MSTSKRFSRPVLVLTTLCFLLCVGTASNSEAGQAGALLMQDGQTIVLEVSVPTPPPSSLIATIKLSPQVKIEATSPGTAKINAKKGQIKWLVKNPRQGSLRFSARTASPPDFSKVSAEVLFRAPGGGSLTKIDAKKR